MRRKAEKRMRGGLCVSGDVICEPTASDLMGAATPYRPYRRTASSVLSIPLNTEPDGICCRTIKAQYYKNSLANFIRTDSFGAGGVLVVFKSDRYPHHTVNAVPCTTPEE